MKILKMKFASAEAPTEEELNHIKGLAGQSFEKQYGRTPTDSEKYDYAKKIYPLMRQISESTNKLNVLIDKMVQQSIENKDDEKALRYLLAIRQLCENAIEKGRYSDLAVFEKEQVEKWQGYPLTKRLLRDSTYGFILKIDEVLKNMDEDEGLQIFHLIKEMREEQEAAERGEAPPQVDQQPDFPFRIVDENEMNYQWSNPYSYNEENNDFDY